MSTEHEKAERVNESFTAGWEDRNLPRMANALPGWVHPDHMTLLGIVAALLIAGGYYLTNVSTTWLLLVNAGLFMHWFGDSLDGTLARVRNDERERYGYFVDHLCDAWTAFVIAFGLGFSPLMDLRVALFAVICYLMMNVFVHVETYVRGTFKLSQGKLGPTETRIIVGGLNMVVMFWNPELLTIGETALTFLDLCALGIGGLLMVVFMVQSIRGAIELDRLDRLEQDHA